jgi:hypothetical protein
VISRMPVGILAAVGLLLNCWAGPAAAEGSSAERSPDGRGDGGMPARLSRQVSPNPGTPWRPPALREYTDVLKAGERVPIDPQKCYDLVELIDLAQRTNPETRVAWEGARQAAIGIGLVQSEYFPMLALAALGGYKSGAVGPIIGGAHAFQMTHQRAAWSRQPATPEFENSPHPGI